MTEVGPISSEIRELLFEPREPYSEALIASRALENMLGTAAQIGPETKRGTIFAETRHPAERKVLAVGMSQLIRRGMELLAQVEPEVYGVDNQTFRNALNLFYGSARLVLPREWKEVWVEREYLRTQDDQFVVAQDETVGDFGPVTCYSVAKGKRGLAKTLLEPSYRPRHQRMRSAGFIRPNGNNGETNPRPEGEGEELSPIIRGQYQFSRKPIASLFYDEEIHVSYDTVHTVPVMTNYLLKATGVDKNNPIAPSLDIETMPDPVITYGKGFHQIERKILNGVGAAQVRKILLERFAGGQEIERVLTSMSYEPSYIKIGSRGNVLEVIRVEENKLEIGLTIPVAIAHLNILADRLREADSGMRVWHGEGGTTNLSQEYIWPPHRTRTNEWGFDEFLEIFNRGLILAAQKQYS